VLHSGGPECSEIGILEMKYFDRWHIADVRAAAWCRAVGGGLFAALEWASLSLIATVSWDPTERDRDADSKHRK